MNAVDVEVCIAGWALLKENKIVITYELFPGTLHIGCRLRDVPLLALLRLMKPPTNTQPLPPILPLPPNHNLLHRMETPPRLHLKKHKLVPTRRHTLHRHRLRLHLPLLPLPFSHPSPQIQLQRPPPVPLPQLVTRQRHIQYIRHAPRPNDVVVVQQVAPRRVRVHRHVPLRTGERPAPRHGAQEGAERGGVERVAQR